MNTYILSVLEREIKKAIDSFTALPWLPDAIFMNDAAVIQSKLGVVFDSYLKIFKNIAFIPSDIEIKTYSFRVSLTETVFPVDDIEEIYLEVMEEINKDKSFRVLRILQHRVADDYFSLFAGISVVGACGENVQFILTKFSIPKSLIRIVPKDSIYLHRLIDEYERDHPSSLPDYVLSKAISYRQFSKDCKNYLEDTFYQYYIKLKILTASGDIIFTDKSLKEIAYTNHFNNYVHMYRVFLKYHLNFEEIPRIFKLSPN